MKNGFLLFILTFISSPLNSTSEIYVKEVTESIIVSLPKVVEIKVIEPKLKFGLDNIKNMISFIKYIKTQSSTLTTKEYREDVYFVIQTMYNRMRHKKCTWRKYYNTPSLNHSQSIRMLKSGQIKQYFNWDDPNDKELYNMAYSCLLGVIEKHNKIPDNILFFESFKNPPDRGVHKMVNFHIKRRHRFYKHEDITI